MNHADPWDEIARLTKQMDVELLRQLRSERQDRVKKRQRASKLRRTTGSARASDAALPRHGGRADPQLRSP